MSAEFFGQGDCNVDLDDDWERWAQLIDWEGPAMIPDVPALAGQLGG
jgi:hypothetical protein